MANGGAGDRRIALLIDADNISHAKIGAVIAEVSRLGTATIRRAYGDWSSDHLNGWTGKLHEFAIRPMQQFSYTQGKNATDIALVIDAMELLYTQKIDGFCIASSDSDFTPLVMKLKDHGCMVYGFGKDTTPKPFAKACTKFFTLEQCAKPTAAPAAAKPAEAKVQVAAKAAAKKPASDKLVVEPQDEAALYEAVKGTALAGGWALLAAACNSAKKEAGIDPKRYKRANISSVFRGTKLFVVAKGGDGKDYIAAINNGERSNKPKAA